VAADASGPVVTEPSPALAPDPVLVAALESRLVNAWPSLEVELAEGWLLRFAEGYSKRANSACAVVPGATLTPDLVRHVLASFAARGVPPCFRLTGLEAPETAGVLDGMGFVAFDPSLALVAPVPANLERDGSVSIAAAAKPRWIENAAAAMGGAKAQADILGRIVRQIRQPAAFATFSLDGDEVAWGLAVAERGYVGLYDIVVAARLRGLGIGRRLVTGLMAWGREQGAERAYLQVREPNAVAAGLYRSLGFTEAYRYTHRVRAEDFPVGTEATSAPDTIAAQASASDPLAPA
jgi:N-acetylglutamate synthase